MLENEEEEKKFTKKGYEGYMRASIRVKREKQTGGYMVRFPFQPTVC
jgi:hypothetical protein